MTWSLSSLVIQIVGGLVGGHVAAILAHEHRFGWIGHTLTGLAGGLLSGTFFQTLVVTMVTGTGSLTEPRPADIVLLQTLTGLASGAIATLVIGFVKRSIDEHKASKN
jgi:uncharacterized membrane protein YeaQ/YmgE (transglycosylase-associated protein family)